MLLLLLRSGPAAARGRWRPQAQGGDPKLILGRLGELVLPKVKFGEGQRGLRLLRQATSLLQNHGEGVRAFIANLARAEPNFA